MYSMTKRDSIGIKAAYNFKHRILLLQGAEKNVTSEITSSGLLTS